MRPCRTNNPEEVFPASVLTTSRLQILPEYSVPGAGHEPTIKSLRGNSLENRACDHSPDRADVMAAPNKLEYGRLVL
jgi:hypothetical protein